MAKFCLNCGAEMQEADLVCSSCGTAAQGNAAPKKADPIESVKALIAKVPKKFIPVIAGAVGVVFLVILITIISSSGSSKSIIKKLEKGFCNSDAKAIVQTVYTFENDDYFEYFVDELDNIFDDDYYIEMMEDEFGDSVKIKKLEILDEIKYKKDSSGYKEHIEKLEDHEDYFNDYIANRENYDEIDFDADMVKGIKEVTYKVTYEGENGTESTSTKTILLIKVKGGWMISPMYII